MWPDDHGSWCRLRLMPAVCAFRQTKNHGKTYHMNFDAGVFTTQGVLDTLLRDGSLTPHTHPHSRKMFHKRASISVRPVLIAADQQERRWRSN